MKSRLLVVLIVLAAGTLQCAVAAENAQCPEFLNHKFKLLHSDKSLNLCSLYSGKPLLIVNTASHCGYTKQFKPLEALYQKYKKRGFQIIGFASNDFNQEAKTEAEAAQICYKNYGVKFTMLAPTHVKGQDANVVFAYLVKKSGEQPEWNFNKYYVSADGGTIKHFNQKVNPLGGELEKLIDDGLGRE